MPQMQIIPGITAAVWVGCYIAKLWLPEGDKKIIPTFAGLTGAMLGYVMLGLSVDAIVAGAVSGLAATGADQLYRQMKKDTEVNDK